MIYVTTNILRPECPAFLHRFILKIRVSRLLFTYYSIDRNWHAYSQECFHQSRCFSLSHRHPMPNDQLAHKEIIGGTHRSWANLISANGFSFLPLKDLLWKPLRGSRDLISSPLAGRSANAWCNGQSAAPRGTRRRSNCVGPLRIITAAGTLHRGGHSSRRPLAPPSRANPANLHTCLFWNCSNRLYEAVKSKPDLLSLPVRFPW